MKRNDGKINWVMIVPLAICLSIIIWAIVGPSSFSYAATSLMSIITSKFGWLYMLGVAAFLVFCLWLALSRYGDIKLGEDSDKPEYSLVSWFAMLFSSGMGIGLIFWGVAEPITHYTTACTTNPFNVDNPGGWAMQKSMLHWCLHPWAIFCIIGLGLAYMSFRKKKPMLVSSIFISLFGEEKCKGITGQIIDIIAVVATVAGVCTSLGLGTLQINGGLAQLLGIPENKLVQMIIVIVISFIFTFTAAVGIEKGISLVADINMILCVVMMVLCFVLGPTIFELNIMTEGIGSYLSSILSDSFTIGAFNSKQHEWLNSWTIFYWAWWVAWAPFCGCFIARISKGRTVREFVAGVLLVPAMLSLLWFGIMGGMGINLGEKMCAIASQNSATACFIVFLEYPLGKIISGICILLVCTFFVTSANSATFVLGMFTSEGDLNPSGKKKTLWGVIEAAFALCLLIATNDGLNMMQTISIAGAFPFLIVMILALPAIYKALSKEVRHNEPEYGAEIRKISFTNAVIESDMAISQKRIEQLENQDEIVKSRKEKIKDSKFARIIGKNYSNLKNKRESIKNKRKK